MARKKIADMSASEAERKREQRRERRRKRKLKKAKELGVEVEVRDDGSLSLDRQELKRRAALARAQKLVNEQARRNQELEEIEAQLVTMSTAGYEGELQADYTKKLDAALSLSDDATRAEITAAYNAADGAQARLIGLGFAKRRLEVRAAILRATIIEKEAA